VIAEIRKLEEETNDLRDKRKSVDEANQQTRREGEAEQKQEQDLAHLCSASDLDREFEGYADRLVLDVEDLFARREP
jgi:hypothetical protein